MRLIALFAAVPLAACSVHAGSSGDSSGADSGSGSGVAASGSGSSRSFAVAGFDAIELRGSDDVDVRVGPAFSVRADGPSKELDQLKIDKDGDTLRVGRIAGVHFDWGGDHQGVKVHVTMPAISAASVAGSGDLTIDKVNGDKVNGDKVTGDKADGGAFKGSSAGSGTLTIAAMTVGDASFSLAGSGDVSASGNARSLAVDIAGSGDLDAGGLSAARATVSVAGSGGVKAAVKGPAQVSVMGSGDVDLGSGAICTTNKLGSGEVRCGD